MYAKPEIEFTDTELIPWQPVAGRSGAFEKILSLDPESGDYTRVIYSQTDLNEALRNYENPMGERLEHEICEEVFIWKGGIIDTVLGQTFGDWFYACRPPHMPHGPLFHPPGCFSVENRYLAGRRTKPEIEFTDTRLIPWRPVKGRKGAYEKILSLDPKNGDYTRLIYSQPDMFDAINDLHHPKAERLEHDIWEEVFILKGSIIDVNLDATFGEGFYACRPPHMPHGPLYHPTGCVSLEFRYHTPD
jgi:hypothetical protein